MTDPEPNPKKKCKRLFRKAGGRYSKGSTGNPAGRPPKHGSGRTRALGIIDEILNKSENQTKLKVHLQNRFNKDPIKFLQQLVIPLIPKESLIKWEHTGKAPIRIMGLFPESDTPSVPEPERVPAGTLVVPDNSNSDGMGDSR